MNALIAADEFSFSSQKWPIRKYEQMPTPSHPTNICMRLLAMTRNSMLDVNIDSTAKNHV